MLFGVDDMVSDVLIIGENTSWRTGEDGFEIGVCYVVVP